LTSDVNWLIIIFLDRIASDKLDYPPLSAISGALLCLISAYSGVALVPGGFHRP
jgi:hypothetical protein